MTTVALIAKECAPGRAKTRLHPPLSLEAAAELAAASLADTIDTVRALPADRRILFLDGDAATVEHEGFEVLAQPEGGLDERLGALFDHVEGPLLLVGMDTPQLAAAHVAPFFASSQDVDGAAAWFGPAEDGGFWALGLREPDGDLIRGVPMSRDDTGAHQRRRLVDAGLDPVDLVALRDVDLIADAVAVASGIPGSRFARTLARVLPAGEEPR